jgi:XTP/dITP diphosphohydrolase
LKERKQTVYFATGNKNKYLEASSIAAAFGVVLKQLDIEKKEIQSEKLADIAAFAAKEAAESIGGNVVAEDAGLFVQGLGGFPGPYSSYVFDTLGLKGILKLLRNVKNRTASFEAVVAYCDPLKRPVCLAGAVRGAITTTARGSHGFGFDPIFVPRGARRTFAEMNLSEKNLYSHRAKAFTSFCKWFIRSRSSETS